MSDPLSDEFQRVIQRAPAAQREWVRRSLQAVHLLGVPTYGQLVASLPSLSGEQLDSALRALVHFGRRKAIAPLLQLLKSPDPEMRGRIPRCLHDLRGERAFQALARCMQEDPDPRIRYDAAYHLQFFFDDRLCDLFLDVLQNRGEQPRVRGQAAEGLHLWPGCGDRRARLYKRVVRGLIEALSDASPEVRFWSCYALGQLRGCAALPHLQRLAETDTEMCPGWWSVRDEASDAMGAIQGKPWPNRERVRTEHT